MTILRKACCNLCPKEEWEHGQGSGWKDWIIIQGVVLDGVDNPMFCKDCRSKIMDYIDNLKHPVLKVIKS